MNGLQKRAKQLKTNIPAIFLALKHKDTPWYAKMTAGITVAYAFSPIDLIPDFIPIFGYLDDILLLPLLIALVVKLIPPRIFAQCKKSAEGMWRDGRPKKWYYAIPVIIIWITAVVAVIRHLSL